MPFQVTDMVAEVRELQKVFKDDPEIREEFHQFELAHIEAERIQYEEIRLRESLTELRKKKNITQKELEQRSGLSQQAVSRIEISKDVSPSLKSLLRYIDAIGYSIKLEPKQTTKTV